MPQTPLFILDGARVEIDGVDVLVILTPFEMQTAEQQEAVMIQLCDLSKQTAVVFSRRLADGQYQFFPPGPWQARLQARSITDLQWTKIPVFPPPSA